MSELIAALSLSLSNSQSIVPTKQRRLVSSVDAVTNRLLRAFLSEKPDENFVFSPLLVHSDLALLYMGADDELRR